MNIHVNVQLENDKVFLKPLLESDFDDLYLVASDPEIWKQHPNQDRWKIEQFTNFFEGAIQSKGAFKVVDKISGKTIGSTRFYDFNEKDKSILIGYTFYATEFWGKGYNIAAKTLMLDHIFQFVVTVYFHIGAANLRSNIAIGRLGVTKVGEQEVTYFGEQSKLNAVYSLTKEEWYSFFAKT